MKRWLLLLTLLASACGGAPFESRTMQCPTGEELASITGSGWVWTWPGLDPLGVEYASLVACTSTPPVRCEVAQNAQLTLRADEVVVDGLVCLGHDVVTVTLSADDPSEM